MTSRPNCPISVGFYKVPSSADWGGEGAALHCHSVRPGLQHRGHFLQCQTRLDLRQMSGLVRVVLFLLICPYSLSSHQTLKGKGAGSWERRRYVTSSSSLFKNPSFFHLISLNSWPRYFLIFYKSLNTLLSSVNRYGSHRKRARDVNKRLQTGEHQCNSNKYKVTPRT